MRYAVIDRRCRLGLAISRYLIARESGSRAALEHFIITSPDAKPYRLGFSAYNPPRFRQSYKWHIDIAGVAKVPFELARLLRASFVPVVLDPTERDNHHISIWFHQFLPRASRSGRAAISSPPP
jgi:hypothetical protein